MRKVREYRMTERNERKKKKEIRTRSELRKRKNM
jgi:hypothetical protein